ncbi:hypothetical protein R3W88_000651 [Solanum pinnatisectum]|uniref:DUF1985 domain-containing protein n=1 Tax=Solanum pinnatisectum TaxID=50273 RepID=A0AAV9MIW1_9SOLN|nr:hypothetical protein R3W88_000651 [Solanum pinnatisectum]
MDQDATLNSSNTNQIVYDSDDENWAENKFKRLHDPLKMKNQSNKEVPSSSKSNSLKYVIKKIPTHSLRFGASYNTNFLDEFKLSIGDVGIKLHANGSILHFTIKEFTLITGLKCKGNIKDFTYPESTPSRLFQRYFPDANTRNSQDALQMTIMYFVHTFILTQLGESSISIDEFLMVEDGMYQSYPWGQIAFIKLMKSLGHDFYLDKKMYRLSGIPYALNVWTYECASQVNSEIVVKERNVISRICNWMVVTVKPKFGMFMPSILSKLIRKSSRDSGTLSPPPPKRRKKVDTPKIKVSEPSQLEQFNIPLNQPFTISDESPAPTANVHIFSHAQKVNSVNLDIEELKEFLKNYVSNDIDFINFSVY